MCVYIYTFIYVLLDYLLTFHVVHFYFDSSLAGQKGYIPTNVSFIS